MHRFMLPARLAVAMALLIGMLAIPKSALAEVWTRQDAVPIATMQADRALAIPGGTLLGDCSPAQSASTAVLQFIPSSTLQAGWSVARDAALQPNPCDIQPAYGSGSTVYLPAVANAKVVLAAYGSATPAWQYALPHGCDSIYALAAAEGRVYAVLRDCEQSKTYLVGVNAATGTQMLATVLNITLPELAPIKGMAAYADGLVLAHAAGIQYVSFSGIAKPAVTVPSMLPPRYLVADNNGRVWLPIRAAIAARTLCGADQAMTSWLEGYSPSGKIGRTPAFPCSAAYTITPTTDGGTLAELWPYGQASLARHRLVSFTASGMQRWELEIPAADSYGHKPGLQFTTMANGTIVLVRNFATAEGRSGVRTELHDAATGAMLEPPYEYTSATASYRQTNFADMPVVTPGNLYLPLRLCTGAGCTIGLHHLQRIELDWAYPGLVAPGTGSTTPPKLEYVALGDSFSSGEGAPPFDPDTNKRSGEKNICHRSAQAYPQLLAKNPALGLRVEGFAACSGATTGQIHHGWPHHKNKKEDINLRELPQAEWVRKSTDLVTITIGGNDVGFATVITQCVVKLCDFGALNANDKISPAYLAVTLRLAYKAIRSRMGPNTKVVVLGYPSLLPPKRAISKGCKWGKLVSLSAREVQALRRLGNRLNAMISQEAARAGFVYAANTALDGHELCTKQPYINPIRIFSHAEYSIHPTALGQRAMATLLADRIKALYQMG